MAPPFKKIAMDAYVSGWATFGLVIVMGPLILGSWALLPIHGDFSLTWYSIVFGFTVGIGVLGVIANMAHTWFSKQKYGSFWDALMTGFLGLGAFAILSQNMIPVIPWDVAFTPIVSAVQLLFYFVGILLLGFFLNIIQKLVESPLDEGLDLPKGF